PTVHHTNSFLVFCFSHAAATTDIYTLSLHDALPIWHVPRGSVLQTGGVPHSSSGVAGTGGRRSAPRRTLSPHTRRTDGTARSRTDRKSTRLNSQSRRDLVCRLLLEKKKATAPAS